MIPSRPSREHLDTFREELWKEHRQLSLFANSDGELRLKKHLMSEASAKSELEVLKSLAEDATLPEVPALYGFESGFAEVEYVKGLRLYRLLNILESLKSRFPVSISVKQSVVKKARSESIQIYRWLSTNKSRVATTNYPFANKVCDLLDIFCESLGLQVEQERVRDEIERIVQELSESDLVPFRDAVPKNIILADRRLWLGTDGNLERQVESIAEYLQVYGDSLESPLLTSRLVHFDFSSCYEKTLLEDDPISFEMHESLSSHSPQENLELWGIESEDPCRSALAVVVRLYRLGGRKLSYKLLHRNGYTRRYANENPLHYFNLLNNLQGELQDAVHRHLPALTSFTETVRKLSAAEIEPETDYFEEVFGAEPDRYYSDVFPF